jgi:hypothetical protein
MRIFGLALAVKVSRIDCAQAAQCVKDVGHHLCDVVTCSIGVVYSIDNIAHELCWQNNQDNVVIVAATAAV